MLESNSGISHFFAGIVRKGQRAYEWRSGHAPAAATQVLTAFARRRIRPIHATPPFRSTLAASTASPAASLFCLDLRRRSYRSGAVIGGATPHTSAASQQVVSRPTGIFQQIAASRQWRLLQLHAQRGHRSHQAGELLLHLSFQRVSSCESTLSARYALVTVFAFRFSAFSRSRGKDFGTPCFVGRRGTTHHRQTTQTQAVHGPPRTTALGSREKSIYGIQNMHLAHRPPLLP